MTAGLESQTWIYRQSAFDAELKLSTTAKSGGVEHHLFLASKGEMKSFDLDGQAICDLTLICQSLDFTLKNCAVSYRFPAFEHLHALWGRIQNGALIAKLFK